MIPLFRRQTDLLLSLSARIINETGYKLSKKILIMYLVRHPLTELVSE